jgi:hypothetical protein
VTRRYVEGKEPPEVIARPRCAWCSARLRPVIVFDWQRVVTGTRTVAHRNPNGTAEDRTYEDVDNRRVNYRWEGRYHAYGAFCKTDCAVKFANAAYAYGTRRKTS